WLAHQPAKGTGQYQDYKWDPRFGNYCATFWIYNPDVSMMPAGGQLPAEMAEMNLNAGYMDGSVRRYGGDEVKWTPDRMYYVPEIWR
ncbi:MAG TPA: hypothetical protein PKB02_11975, partial [Anaerohalosphaeraceae bacterium]|nr:hypothetical protein [Anaerohalosphaeraceae bacterium]